jgi:hypothetical protein
MPARIPARTPSQRARRLPVLLLAWLSALLLVAGVGAPVRAEDSDSEAPDPTRLDVERLPPEAIAITRDMFARGFLLETFLGSRAFLGGVDSLAQPGLLARIGLGYELWSWLTLGAGVELSMHTLEAPVPPTHGNFQLVDALVEARFALPLSARAALWLGAEGGVALTLGNLLEAHGVSNADSPGLMYGGSLGFDWHLLSRHHSLGLLAGLRAYPQLDMPDGDRSFAFHSAAYLKYVF